MTINDFRLTVDDSTAMRRIGLILLLQHLAAVGFCLAGSVPFAENGTLKMLYDNRMYPQAVEDDGHIYVVWRGTKGLPYITAYDLSTSAFSEPVMVLNGLDIEIDAEKYERDHHYAPVIWIDVSSFVRAPCWARCVRQKCRQ